jgi:hypothetical protein
VLLGSSLVAHKSRGVYPLGMSAVNSGAPRPRASAFSQLLFYSRDQAKDDGGATLPVTGYNTVLMDLNSFKLGERGDPGRRSYSAAVTVPFARNELTSDPGGRSAAGPDSPTTYFTCR